MGNEAMSPRNMFEISILYGKEHRGHRYTSYIKQTGTMKKRLSSARVMDTWNEVDEETPAVDMGKYSRGSSVNLDTRTLHESYFRLCLGTSRYMQTSSRV